MSSRKQTKQIPVAALLSIFCCYQGVHSFVPPAAQPPPLFSRLRISPQPRQLSPRQARLHDIYVARSRLHVKTSYGKLCVIGSSSSSSQQDSFIGEAKGLFRQACDEQDLMTLDTFKGMAFVTELLVRSSLILPLRKKKSYFYRMELYFALYCSVFFYLLVFTCGRNGWLAVPRLSRRSLTAPFITYRKTEISWKMRWKGYGKMLQNPQRVLV